MSETTQQDRHAPDMIRWCPAGPLPAPQRMAFRGPSRHKPERRRLLRDPSTITSDNVASYRDITPLHQSLLRSATNGVAATAVTRTRLPSRQRHREALKKATFSRLWSTSPWIADGSFTI
jgi:hypothetical protein